MSGFEVKVMRLKTGEDLIGQVRSPNIRDEKEADLTDVIFLKNAQVMILQNAGEGKMGFSFIPFFPFTRPNVEIKVPLDYVALREDPNAELLSNYNTHFGTGLVIAPAGSVPPSDGRGGISGNIRIA